MVGTNYTLFENIFPLALKRNYKSSLSIPIILLALFLCVTISSQDNSAVAQSSTGNASDSDSRDLIDVNSTVSVTGSALTRLAPDRVHISIGVEST